MDKQNVCFVQQLNRLCVNNIKFRLGKNIDRLEQDKCIMWVKRVLKRAF